MTVHLTHWGTFEAVSDGERLTGVRPWRGDPEPMPLTGNVASAQHHPARITQPHVRKGWLEHRPSAHGASAPGHSAPEHGAPGRGSDPFVPVSWETALGLLSGELRRVYRDHGAEAVYGGSYGFLGRYTVGFGRFARYLRGEADGVVKDPAWASALEQEDLPRLRAAIHQALIPVNRISCRI